MKTRGGANDARDGSPGPLSPAITLPREVIEVAISQHLAVFGKSSLVARTWHSILHGGEPGPISHMDWSKFDGDGPPSRATLAAESTAWLRRLYSAPP